MSFNSEYQALRKKRKKQEEENKQVIVSGNPLNTVQPKTVISGNPLKTSVMDFAPVRIQATTKSPSDAHPWKATYQGESEVERTWFTKGAFEDGYDVGDITKTILGTVGDVGVNLLGSLGDISEGLLNVGASAVGGVAGLLGNDELQKETEYFIKEDKVYGADDVTDFAEMLTGVNVDELSVLGEKLDSVAQSGGQLLTASALQMIGIPWWLTMGTSSFGGKMSESLNEGATYNEALVSSAISTGAELLTEKLSGGVKFGGKALDDVFTQKLATSISNKFVRTAVKLGMDVTGEGAEEVLSQGISNFGDWLTYRDDEELKEVLASEEAVDEYIEAFIGGGLIGGIAGGVKAGASAKRGVDYTSQLTADEERVVNSIYENRIKESETDGKKVTQREKNKIYDDVVRDLEKGYISTDTIEEVLGGETYKTYKDTIDNETALQDEFNTLNKMKQGDMTGEQADRKAELKQQLEDLKNNSNKAQLKEQLDNEMFNIVKNSRLAESYNEIARKGQLFEADYSKFKDAKHQDAVKQTLENAVKSNINNTNRMRDVVEMNAKFSGDTGLVFHYKSGEEIKNNFIERQTAKIKELESIAERTPEQNEYIEKLKDKLEKVKSGKIKVNGEFVEGGIVINLDNPTAFQVTTGHEITHKLEKANSYENLMKALKRFAGKDFDRRVAEQMAIYEGVSGYDLENLQKDVEREVVADLVGEYLFTDSDFINNLLTENQNLFKRIYNEIKYLCKIATAGSREARELEKVKRAFEKVYKESANTKAETKTKKDAKTSYSLTAETESKYNEAVKNNDIATAQRLVDDVAKKNGYTRKMFHETDAENIHIFDTSLGTHGATDSETPYGIFTKSSDKNIGLGNIQMALYVKADNTLYVKNRAEVKAKIPELIPYYDEIARIDEEYEALAKDFENAEFDALEEWMDENPDADMDVVYPTQYIIDNKPADIDSQKYLDAFAEHKRIMEEWKEEYNKVAVECKELITTHLRNNGYDSMYFKVDAGSRGRQTDSLILLDSNQVKSADAVTYDDNGNVIPLSERFKAENKDIRYSLSAEQEDYFKDSVVRDDNGNLKVMYHGTSKGGHTVFDTFGESRFGLFGAGTYFTDNKDIAKSYTEKGRGNSPQVYEAYLNITNPIDMDAKADINAWQKAFHDADYSNCVTNEDCFKAMKEVFVDEEYPQWEAKETAMDVLQSMGYDGITHIGGGRVNADGTRHQVYIAFEPEQIKNIDNIAPTKDADIRYSLSESDDYSRIQQMQLELNEIRNKIAEFEKSEDYKSQMAKLTQAFDSDVENGIKEYARWQETSGYGELISRKNTLQTELEKTRKEYSEKLTNAEVEKEKIAIEKSGLSEADYFRKQAVKEFGYTPYFYDAGYITPNGKMLNFSGEKGRHFGSRGQDHRAIGTIFADTQGTDALNRFMKDGNIRIIAESPAVDVSAVVEPTKEQYSTIRKFIYEYAEKGYFAVDFSDENGTVVGSLGYENNINPTRIINDIKHYYETGEVRQQSNTDKFRYSLSEDSKDRVFYTPFGVEVVQNPTNAEYRQMREDIYNAYPHLRGTGEGILRHTYDEEGNEYYWSAYDGMHSSVEPYINKHYNTRTSQHWEWWKRDNKDDYPTNYSNVRYSLSDSEGNTLTEEQNEYFKDSKIRDANGSLKVMHHGSHETFTVFDKKKARSSGTYGNGFYFTDSESHAGTYGDSYDVYLNITNPLQDGTNNITKDQLRKFVEAIAENEDYGIENYGYGATIDSVTDSVYGKSDFGMIMDVNISCVGNMVEAIELFNEVNGTDYNGIVAPTETVAFYPNQIKSVTNKKPTSNPDIRYSLSAETETKYNEAVKNNDIETAQKIVDGVAKEWGAYSEKLLPKTFYHQTENKFTVFDTKHKGSGTRDNETPFGVFLKPNNNDIGIKGDIQMPLYAKITNPLIAYNRQELSSKLKSISTDYAKIMEEAKRIDNEYQKKCDEARNELRNYIIRVREEEKRSGVQPKSRKDLYADETFNKLWEAEDNIIKEWTETASKNDYKAKLEINKILETNGYDGLILKIDAGSFGRSVETYIALNPNQIKSAEPITYDDNGNVIPLSERFSDGNNDIRYSLLDANNLPKLQGSHLAYGKDARVQGTDIAPVETVAENTTVAPAETTEQVAPDETIPDGFAPISEEEAIAYARENLDSLDDADAPPVRDTEYYSLEDDIAIDTKSLRQLTKTISDSLFIKNKGSKAELEKVIQDFSNNKYSSKEELYADIERRFGTVYTEELNDILVEAKDYVRNTKIYVSPNLKSEFGSSPKDYTQFMRSNFGKIKFAKDGTEVDSVYENLNEMYPHLFPDDIWNPADRLKRIAEVVNKPSKDLIPEALPSEMIEEATDLIYNSVLEYKDTERMNIAYDTFNESNEHLFGNLDDIAPIDDATIEEYSPKVKSDNEPIKTVKDRNVAKLEGLKTELRNNYEMRKEAFEQYNQKIAKLQAEYNGKKDKITSVANGILQSIERYTRLRDTTDAQYEKRINDLRDSIDKMNSKEFKTAEHRATKQEEHKTLIENLIGDTSTWKDKKMGLYYKVNTLRRNLRDIVRDANGNRDIARADAIYEELQGKYNHNEAELNRTSTQIKKTFADMKINKYEDAYIQMLGELRHNPATTLTEDVVNEYLEKYKDKIDEAKVDTAINKARALYDDLIRRVNVVLKNQGMKEIEYRKGYFPHFTEEKQGTLAKLFNWKTKNNEIPTDIAGLTEMFNPERSWQSFNKQRKSDVTDYSFLKGLDMYVQGSLDWIYHIEDIQKRRAFENYIRYVHSEQGIKDRIDAINNDDMLSAEEVQEQIDLVYKEAGNPLNNFVTDFRTQTNTLAGKKSSMDRGMEEMTNRKFYSTMTNVSNRVTANMVGGSVSSALTNFIPITQSWGQVSPISSLKAMGDTIKSTFSDDGTVNKSDFLTNRLRKTENLYQTTWDKVSDKASLLMESIDSFTSQTVWRSKYLENISNGMSENEAIKNADQFAENVLAGRSRGNNPTIFDSKNPLIKTLTAFQLEVNNQYGYMFKDMPQDMQNESKAKLVKGYATMFVGAYVYNALYSALTGRDTAFDPIGIIEDLLRDLGFGDDDEEEEINGTDVVMNLTENVLQEVPFVGGLLGGGRVPLSSALPYGDNFMEAFEGTVTDIAEGNIEHLFKEYLSSVGAYVVAPVGGGQIRKTMQGLSMYSDEHPIAGSYTDSGKLRFTAGNKWQDVLQSALFGQYSSATARQYFDEGRTPLSEKQTQELIDVDISIQDYWKYRDGLAKQETMEDKFEYINGLDLSDEQKNVLINNIVDRKEDVDISNYDDFGNYDEFDFYTKNTEKYEFLQTYGVSYAEYTADEDTKENYDSIYSWYKNNPEKVTVSRAVTDNVIEYKGYTKALNDIHADKDSNGNSIRGTAKEKKLDYINNLDIDYGARLILFKSEYPADDTYNNDIIDYLNENDNISAEEMKTILLELGFMVDSEGYISW